MENLDQFRKETKEWLEENCPPEMRKPMGPGDVVWGGRNCKFPHPDAKLWLERYPNLVGVLVNKNSEKNNKIFGNQTFSIVGKPFLKERFFIMYRIKAFCFICT